MSIEKIIKTELQIEENFDYHKLYNDSRGAVHKEDCKLLLNYCIEEKVIEVKKYLIEENIDSDVFYDIADRKGKEYYSLKEALKDYHQESYYKVAPFIYLLGLIESNYRINSNRKEPEEAVLEFPQNISVGYRFKGTNAFSRLHFKDNKTVINSSNDSVQNLIDTLEIDGITVYILDVEEPLRSKEKIVLYKLTKNEMFNKLKVKAKERFIEEIRKFII